MLTTDRWYLACWSRAHLSVENLTPSPLQAGKLKFACPSKKASIRLFIQRFSPELRDLNSTWVLRTLASGSSASQMEGIPGEAPLRAVGLMLMVISSGKMLVGGDGERAGVLCTCLAYKPGGNPPGPGNTDEA